MQDALLAFLRFVLLLWRFFFSEGRNNSTGTGRVGRVGARPARGEIIGPFIKRFASLTSLLHTNDLENGFEAMNQWGLCPSRMATLQCKKRFQQFENAMSRAANDQIRRLKSGQSSEEGEGDARVACLCGENGVDSVAVESKLSSSVVVFLTKLCPTETETHLKHRRWCHVLLAQTRVGWIDTTSSMGDAHAF